MGEPNPSLPIPNDDPRCHCARDDRLPGDGVVLIAGGMGGEIEARVALHVDCPHHGQIARSVQRSATHGFSIASAS